MKTIVLFVLLFISFVIKAQEPEKKKSTLPPPGSGQERSINEPGIKPKKKGAPRSRASEPAPAPALPPQVPLPVKKDTLRKPE